MAAFGLPTMLTQEQTVEIKVLARRGVAIRDIARQLGCSRNTVRRYLKEADALRYGPRPARATKPDPFKAYVLERIKAARPHWIPAAVLYREIAELGHVGGLTQLNDGADIGGAILAAMFAYKSSEEAPQAFLAR